MVSSYSNIVVGVAWVFCVAWALHGYSAILGKHPLNMSSCFNNVVLDWVKLAFQQARRPCNM